MDFTQTNKPSISSLSPNNFSIRTTAPRYKKYSTSPRRFKYLPTYITKSSSKSRKADSHTPETTPTRTTSESPKFYPYISRQLYLCEPDSIYKLHSNVIQTVQNDHNSWLSEVKNKGFNYDFTVETYKKQCKDLRRQIKVEFQANREELMGYETLKNPHSKAVEYFKVIKSGDFLTLQTLVVMNPELVNEADSTLQTGLHWAVKRADLRLVKFLISYGANIKIPDSAGRTPDSIARKNKNFDILKEFIAIERRSAIDLSKEIQHGSKKFEGFRKITELKSRLRRHRNIEKQIQVIR